MFEVVENVHMYAYADGYTLLTVVFKLAAASFGQDLVVMQKLVLDTES